MPRFILVFLMSAMLVIGTFGALVLGTELDVATFGAWAPPLLSLSIFLVFLIGLPLLAAHALKLSTLLPYEHPDLLFTMLAFACVFSGAFLALMAQNMPPLFPGQHFVAYSVFALTVLLALSALKRSMAPMQPL